MDGFNNGKPSSFGFGSDSRNQDDSNIKNNKPMFTLNTSTNLNTPSFSFEKKPDEIEKPPSFSFGSTSNTGFNFGSKPTEPVENLSTFGKPTETIEKPTSFGFGLASSTTQPAFSGFGKSTEAKTKPSLFGNSESGTKPSLFEFGKPSTEIETITPSFGSGKKEDVKPIFGANTPKVGETKSLFEFNKPEEAKQSFGNLSTASKPLLFGNSSTGTTTSFTGEIQKPEFSFGNKKEEFKKEESKPSFSFGVTLENKSEKLKDTKTVNTEKDEDQFMKDYQAPSINHAIEDNDINDTEHLNNDRDDDDEEDADEFYDVEIDEKTNLPIRKLNYNDNAKSLLSNGEHLKFSISGKTENGMLFVTESEDKIGKKDNDAQNKTQLFPFKLIQEMDSSIKYKEFLNKMYKEFEPLLRHKKYKNYIEDDDEYMNIGVYSVQKNDKEERLLFLRQLMTFSINNLNELINNKLSNDFETLNDEWVANYEQIINVLFLLNALEFGNNDETIVLFQQWIERIDIQPTDELIERVLDECDKPYQNGKFWSDYVKKFVLRGSFSKLVDDLKSSQFEELKSIDNELFKLIENLIGLIQSYDPISFSQNIESFFAWKRVAVELRETANDICADNMIIVGEIIDILYIMTGSPKTIEECATTWYECFMGHFLYQMPSKELIKKYVSESLELDTYEKPLKGIPTWDSICVELFEGKYLSVIADIELLDKSIGTFTAIIMEAAGLLNVYNKEISNTDLINKKISSNNISKNIDRMLEDLALTYLNNQELFAIGIGILVSVDNAKSREIVAELLPTYEIKDSDDFEWVLSICSQLKLADTMKTIQQIQGEKFYNKQLIANALSCFAESKSTDKIVATVWRLFEEMMINQKLDEDLSIQLFSSDISKNNAIMRQSLSPLYTLNQILQNNDIYDEIWFNRLYGLLEFKYLPQYYKCGLLLIIYDNLNKNVFSMEKLVAIIENLNKYEKEMEKDEELKSKSSSMYSLLLKSRVSKKSRTYPKTLLELLLEIRRGIAMDVSFAFLDETIY